MQFKINPKIAYYGILGAFILFFVGCIDSISGYNMNLSVLYYIPVALWAWNIGMIPGILMAIACASGWALNDYFSGHLYASGYYRVWNIGTELIAFQLIAVGTALLSNKLRREAELNYRLRHTMVMLEKSVSEVRHLQGQPIIFCTITKRVKVGDEWVSLHQFLHDKLDLSIKESVSDEAMADMVHRVTEYYEYHDAAHA